MIIENSKLIMYLGKLKKLFRFIFTCKWFKTLLKVFFVVVVFVCFLKMCLDPCICVYYRLCNCCGDAV